MGGRQATVELVARARAGDRRAFEQLAADSVDALFATAQLILRDADAAADATQEALLRCWRDLPKLREVDRFDAWIHRLLVRAAHDEIRALRRHRARVTFLQAEPRAPDDSRRVMHQDLIERGFTRLSIDHRVVLVLRLYAGLTIEETAMALDVPTGTVKSRLHHAAEALRMSLEADGVRMAEALA